MKSSHLEGKNILVVLTSHATHASGKPTGYWLSELTHFYDVAHAADITLHMMSPAGGEPPMDPASRNMQDPISAKWMGDSGFTTSLLHTKKPQEVNAEDYAAIYYPGGHGPMWDLAQNRSIAEIAARIYENGGVVAAVCHGPAALLPVTLADGMSLLAGKTVTGFSNNEERLSGKRGEVPFLLQNRLHAQAKRYTKAFLPFRAHVEVDGRVVTGQNPQSAKGVGEAVVQLLSGR
jgi:putative intracellular protease/amidase